MSSAETLTETLAALGAAAHVGLPQEKDTPEETIAEVLKYLRDQQQELARAPDFVEEEKGDEQELAGRLQKLEDAVVKGWIEPEPESPVLRLLPEQESVADNAGNAPSAIATQDPVTGTSENYAREDNDLALALVGSPADVAPPSPAHPTLEFTTDSGNPEVRSGLQVKLDTGYSSSVGVLGRSADGLHVPLGFGISDGGSGLTVTPSGQGTVDAIAVFDVNGNLKDADGTIKALQDLQLASGKDLLAVAAAEFTNDLFSAATPGGPFYVSEGNIYAVGAAANFFSHRVNGTWSGPTKLLNSEIYANYQFRGRHGGGAYGTGATIAVQTREAWDDANSLGSQMTFSIAEVAGASPINYLQLDGSNKWVKVSKSFRATGIVNALGGFYDNGVQGVDGTTAGGDTVSGGIITAIGALAAMPTGVIVAWGGSSLPPTGWLDCDASAKSRTTYDDLWTQLGTTYGAGDGSTTFNLPAGAGKVMRGNTPGTGGGSDTHTTTITGSSATITTGITENKADVRADQIDVSVVQSLTDLGHSHGPGTYAGASANNIPANTGVMWIIKT